MPETVQWTRKNLVRETDKYLRTVQCPLQKGVCFPADDVGQVVRLVLLAVPLLLAVDGERVVVIPGGNCIKIVLPGKSILR